MGFDDEDEVVYYYEQSILYEDNFVSICYSCKKEFFKYREIKKDIRCQDCFYRLLKEKITNNKILSINVDHKTTKEKYGGIFVDKLVSLFSEIELDQYLRFIFEFVYNTVICIAHLEWCKTDIMTLITSGIYQHYPTYDLLKTMCNDSDFYIKSISQYCIINLVIIFGANNDNIFESLYKLLKKNKRSMEINFHYRDIQSKEVILITHCIIDLKHQVTDQKIFNTILCNNINFATFIQNIPNNYIDLTCQYIKDNFEYQLCPDSSTLPMLEFIMEHNIVIKKKQSHFEQIIKDYGIQNEIVRDFMLHSFRNKTFVPRFNTKLKSHASYAIEVMFNIDEIGKKYSSRYDKNNSEPLMKFISENIFGNPNTFRNILNYIDSDDSPYNKIYEVLDVLSGYNKAANTKIKPYHFDNKIKIELIKLFIDKNATLQRIRGIYNPDNKVDPDLCHILKLLINCILYKNEESDDILSREYLDEILLEIFNNPNNIDRVIKSIDCFNDKEIIILSKHIHLIDHINEFKYKKYYYLLKSRQTRIKRVQ